MSDDRILQQFRLNLRQIPDLYALLPAYRLPGSRPADPDKRSGKSNPAHQTLLDWTVIDLLDERDKDADATRTDYDTDRMAGARRCGVLPTLASWVRLVDGELWDAGEEHENPAEDPTVRTEAGFLLDNAEWIREQQWGHECVDEAHRIWADIRRAVGVRDEQKLACTECGWDEVEEDEGRSWALCPACGKTWVYGNELAKLNKEQASRMSLREVANELQVSVRTVQSIKTEAGIVHVDIAGRNRIYDIREFQAAMSNAVDRRLKKAS